MNERVGPYVPPSNREFGNREGGTSMTRIKDMMQKTMKRFDATNENVKEMRNDLSGIGQKVDAHAVSIKQLEQQFFTACEGKQIIDPPPSEVERVVEKDEDEIKVSEDPKIDTEKEAEVTQKVVPMSRPPPPFPHRLVKKTEEGKYCRFISMLKQLSVNVPLIEGLEQMPGSVKFMKDLVTKKRVVSFENDERVQHCSVIATRSLVQKKEDLGAFTIPCTIGILHFAKALCDLGANINLMSLSIYKKLGLGAPKPTVMLLLMADRTVKRPIGVIQDVLVKELKALPFHLRYAFLGKDSTLHVIIVADLSEGKIEALVSVLKRFKRDIGWTITYIIGIPPGICSHKIQLMSDSKPSIEHQRRLNPHMQEYVSKKEGITVVPNAKNEFVPMRPVTGWRVCMDYRNLNAWTEKDHFPMPFMDQMLDHLTASSTFLKFDSHLRYFNFSVNLHNCEVQGFAIASHNLNCNIGELSFR
ncbi:uncharacterized protein LOC125858885 [Solanum stenotomum]|uniref:uncharacterized protein LOC125858885 n=1 Tax=Solanum stenotomum TaxID=172797 RepID=UPI0020D1CDE2|nr:uncharacterized protein LOC125858885 [Solanum stenotomum]